MKMQNLWLIIVAFVVIIVGYVFAIYNSFVRLKTSVEEAFATMDVYLKQRWDLIPNIVEVVKGYAAHENAIFSEVTNLRNKPYTQMSSDEKIQQNQKISSAMSNLFAVAEAYPDLKANTMFSDLSAQMSRIESDIANSRKYYNGVVKVYNIKVLSVPSNIIAGIFKFSQIKMYEIDSSERENVKVEF